MSTKENVLALLENGRGKSVSGGQIAKLLNISRNAVWKAVQELEKDGHRIDAVPGRGYCLSPDSDILSAQGILPFLEHTFENIFVYPSLASTNNTAKEMALSGAAHGTVVLSDSQTAGRGRFGREFYSPAGSGLYMSIILQPDRLRLPSPTLVTVLAAISVAEAIEAVSGQSPRIKWVNDIFLNGKKVCGILTEAVTDFESGGIQWVVSGIGVNVSTMYFPNDLPHAGAVCPGNDAPVTRNRLAAEIINRMLREPSEATEILDKYKNRLMVLGKRILIQSNQHSYEALAVGVDSTGSLLVDKGNNEIVALSAGEIRIIE